MAYNERSKVGRFRIRGAKANGFWLEDTAITGNAGMLFDPETGKEFSTRQEAIAYAETLINEAIAQAK